MRDLSTDTHSLSINTVTLRALGGLENIVHACARHGVPAIAPWRHEIATLGPARAAKLIRDAGLVVSGYLRAGFFAGDTARRQKIRDDNRRAVDEAAALGVGCPLVVVPGGLPQFAQPGSRATKDLGAARALVEEELAELLPHARAAGVPLAFEPLHPMQAAERGCNNTLGQALDICERLDPEDSGGIGVAVDVYHVWWDPELAAGISRAGKRILTFHVCDWLTPTRHMLNDRGMMGDGVIDIPAIRRLIENAGYRGFVEVEIFSDAWWAVSPDTLITTIRDRFRRFV
jgi:sugar phosphate isomerase/epimerase